MDKPVMDIPINIVLVSLYRNQNFAIRTLHSVLERIDGITPYSIFFKDSVANIAKEPTIEEERLFADKIKELNPELVGISVLSPYAIIAKRLTKIIKENSSALVIWGGAHPTILPDRCICDADMVCIGEGEGPLTELVLAIKNKGDYSNIKNLWVKQNGGLIKNPMRPLIKNLDTIPPPSYGSSSFFFIDHNRITKSDPMILDNRLDILTSRGCPFICTFCINSILNPLYRDLGNGIRIRSIENILAEIKNQLSISKGRKNYVVFGDEVFGWDRGWVNKFVSLYPKQIGLPFSVECNPKVMESSVFTKLAESGLDAITIGIQSGSDDIRKNIFRRPEQNAEIIKADSAMKKRGICVSYDLIVDNPYETEESLKNTIAFLMKLSRPLSFNYFSLQYFPNYPLTKKALEEGHIKESDLAEWALFKNATKNWMYDPKFSFRKKMILQNIIWLMINNRAKDSIVRYAVESDSFTAKACLWYLNLKSIFLGRIYGKSGIKRRFLQRYYRIRYLINEKKARANMYRNYRTVERRRTIQDRTISGFNIARYAITEPLLLRLARFYYEYQYKDVNENPLVSVYIPTYNRAKLLMERAVPSVLAQTYKNFELIIIGDHCTDNTQEAILQVKDPRIRFCNLPERKKRYPPTAELHWLAGPVVPANKGLELARGKWIARIDDDDIWTPDHLEVLLRFAQEDNYEFVSAAYITERHGKKMVIDAKGDKPQIGGTQTWLYRSYLRFMKYNINCWRKSWNRVNDADIQDRIYRAGVRMGFLDKVVAYVLPRPGETTVGLEAYKLTAVDKEKHFTFA